MKHPGACEIIEHLGLEPLGGEGGYFRETWSTEGIGDGPAPHGTAIYYLITPESWSALHRLAFDEIFHVYVGDPCEMVVAREPSWVEHVRLGHDILGGERVQHIVPAGCWQGTKLAPGGEWALFGTTMAPGFRPDVFELADRDVLNAFDPEAGKQLEAYLP